VQLRRGIHPVGPSAQRTVNEAVDRVGGDMQQGCVLGYGEEAVLA
jgi:hypothetical protein